MTRRITLLEMQADQPRAVKLASLPGGVDVTDADGNLRFHLSIPGEPLGDDADVARAETDRVVSVLSRVMRTLRRSAGSPEEQAVYADAREVLAMHGAREAEVAEMQSAYEEWAGRRAP